MKHSIASKFQKRLDEGRIREVCDACLDQMTAMLERAVENKIDLRDLTLTLVDDDEQVLVALHAIDELSKIMPFELPPTMPATRCRTGRAGDTASASRSECSKAGCFKGRFND